VSDKLQFVDISRSDDKLRFVGHSVEVTIEEVAWLIACLGELS
jgi:hypothetical protein